jgi:glycosyltransferase 2 family protein
MGSKLKKRIFLSIVFGALIFLALTVYADYEKLGQAFASFNWLFLPVVILCATTNFALRYLKWDYYTLKLGIRPDPKKNVLFFFAAFTMAVTPGKFGEVIKSYLLKQENQTPISKSAPVILAERLTDFIGLIALLLAGAFVFQQSRFAVLIIAAVFTIVTVLLSWRKGSLAVIGLLTHLPIIKNYVHHARTAYESIYILLRPGTLTVAVLISIVSWFFECLGFWIILHVFEVPIPMLQATFIYAFSTIIGAVSMLPGGLGTTEGSLTGLTMLAGASKDVAVASTLLIRLATLWYAVLLGVVVSFVFRKQLNIDISEIPLDKSAMED